MTVSGQGAKPHRHWLLHWIGTTARHLRTSRRHPADAATTASARPPGSIPVVKAFRRALVSLFVAATAMVIVRLRGSGGTPPRRGGWRELPTDELA
jgi:hypothetical protein